MHLASVDHERLSVEPRRVVAGEEKCGTCDVIRLPRATKGDCVDVAARDFGCVGAVIGVSTNPGAMALTRTPRGPSSSAATRVSISTPAFAQQYATIPSPG